MKFTLSLLVSLLFSIAANAQTPNISRVDIVEAGIYQQRRVSTAATPYGSGVKDATVADIKLIKSTTTIPARIGTNFGFRYKIVGHPQGGRVNLKFVTRFPPPGIRDTSTNKTILKIERSATQNIGEVNYHGGSFDEAGDMVQGKWVIEIWDGSQKLAEQEFTVVAP